MKKRYQDKFPTFFGDFNRCSRMVLKGFDDKMEGDQVKNSLPESTNDDIGQSTYKIFWRTKNGLSNNGEGVGPLKGGLDNLGRQLNIFLEGFNGDNNRFWAKGPSVIIWGEILNENHFSNTFTGLRSNNRNRVLQFIDGEEDEVDETEGVKEVVQRTQGTIMPIDSRRYHKQKASIDLGNGENLFEELENEDLLKIVEVEENVNVHKLDEDLLDDQLIMPETQYTDALFDVVTEVPEDFSPVKYNEVDGQQEQGSKHLSPVQPIADNNFSVNPVRSYREAVEDRISNEKDIGHID
ncbi:hypothetical protein LguiB_031948 [Lonicera macranthoides]